MNARRSRASWVLLAGVSGLGGPSGVRLGVKAIPSPAIHRIRRESQRVNSKGEQRTPSLSSGIRRSSVDREGRQGCWTAWEGNRTRAWDAQL